MFEVAQEGRDTASVGEPSTDQPVEPSASVRSRTRSGRMSVFWWPTALWFVSGATTVDVAERSSACFSARIPRDSMPSSFVIDDFGGGSSRRAAGTSRRRARDPARATRERLAAFKVEVASFRAGRFRVTSGSPAAVAMRVLAVAHPGSSPLRSTRGGVPGARPSGAGSPGRLLRGGRRRGAKRVRLARTVDVGVHVRRPAPAAFRMARPSRAGDALGGPPGDRALPRESSVESGRRTPTPPRRWGC